MGLIHLKMFNIKPIHVCLALAVLVVGCKNEENEDQNAPTIPAVEFKGEVDKSFAGKWQTKDKRLVLTLEESGAASMIGKISSPGGEKDVNSKMDWKIDSGKLLFKNEDGTTSGYMAKMKGSTLELSTSKTTSVYTKM